MLMVETGEDQGEMSQHKTAARKRKKPANRKAHFTHLERENRHKLQRSVYHFMPLWGVYTLRQPAAQRNFDCPGFMFSGVHTPENIGRLSLSCEVLVLLLFPSCGVRKPHAVASSVVSVSAVFARGSTLPLSVGSSLARRLVERAQCRSSASCIFHRDSFQFFCSAAQRGTRLRQSLPTGGAFSDMLSN